ncbi:MAG: hypothetical protein LIO90_05145 [Bacteroidales bacterium]|nr:hypothetical protein [Bacteroidales bacterium]
MRTLYVLHPDTPRSIVESSTLLHRAMLQEGRHSDLVRLEKSLLSPITHPITLSKEIPEEGKVLIHIDSPERVNMATMARNLAKNPQAKIVVWQPLPYPTQRSPHISEKLEKEIDLWLPQQGRTQINHKGHQDGKLHLVVVKAEEVDLDFTTIIRGLTQLDPNKVHLTVVGTWHGRDIMPVIRESRRLGTEPMITWAGDVADPTEILSTSDAALMISRKATSELFSHKALYLGASLPIIATASHPPLTKPSSPGIVEIKEASSEEMAEAVRSITDKAMLQRLQQEAHSLWEQKYDFNLTFREVKSLYHHNYYST